MRKWLLAICLTGWMQASDGGPALALAAPSIQSLGVPVGFIDFTPTDVNSDGSVIVGTSQTPAVSFSFAVRGFLWTAGGFQDLGSLGGDSVRRMLIPGLGDVVVGVANLAPGSVAFRIFRWTAATGIQDLGPTFGATPASISTDGTTMAALLASSGPVRWTAAQGFTPISVPSVADPYDISGDGSVVVANDFGLVYTAYRWTAAGGAVALPNLGGCSSDRIANSISSSGAVTVGYSTYKSKAARPGDCPPMAVRWNGTAIQQLGFLPNGFRSVARGVSADGSVVVGYSNTTGNAQDGFIWKSATNKMQDLNQVLAGVPGAAGRVVTDAIAVSDDGNVIAAIALNMNTRTLESVRIVLGGATTCAPTSCFAQGKNCGSIADGCGGTLNCGTCAAPQTCGGGGVANVCSAAAFTPTTCAVQGKNCGTIADGCGGTLGCGVCAAPQTCGGGGAPNVCGAAATTATLTLTATGRGGERATSNPAGLSVPTGSTAAATFAVGTVIN